MTQYSEPKRPYRGRFAPSPSGPLHFGSLLCALASYLDARANNGVWLIRVEDIDPPREQQGAAAGILRTLEAHGMVSDEPVLFQSTRTTAYRERLDYLLKQNLAYRCNCTRKRLADLRGNYDGHCLQYPPPLHTPAAIRLNLHACKQYLEVEHSYDDLIQGKHIDSCEAKGDFVIHRKDGLFAYQLAVVADDIQQGISQVVRGADLLDTTMQQRLLFRLFAQEPPSYAHLPVLVDMAGNKLSKQNHARAVNNETAFANLCSAFHLLGLQVPVAMHDDIPALLAWGARHWNLAQVPRCSCIVAPSHTM